MSLPASLASCVCSLSLTTSASSGKSSTSNTSPAAVRHLVDEAANTPPSPARTALTVRRELATAPRRKMNDVNQRRRRRRALLSIQFTTRRRDRDGQLESYVGRLRVATSSSPRSTHWARSATSSAKDFQQVLVSASRRRCSSRVSTADRRPRDVVPRHARAPRRCAGARTARGRARARACARRGRGPRFPNGSRRHGPTTSRLSGRKLQQQAHELARRKVDLVRDVEHVFAGEIALRVRLDPANVSPVVRLDTPRALS